MGMKALQSQKTLDESSSASSLIEDLKREFRNQTFADLTLICKGFFPLNRLDSTLTTNTRYNIDNKDSAENTQLLF